MKHSIRKPLGNTVWFKIILTLLMFLPTYTQISYNSADTTKVIAAVMSHPLAYSVNWILPIAKLLLLFAVLLPVLSKKFSQGFFLGYYSIILLIVGILQNMSYTKSYGFTWIVGNTLVQIIVAVFCTKRGNWRFKQSGEANSLHALFSGKNPDGSCI